MTSSSTQSSPSADTLRELSDLVFENAEKMPDGVYKSILDGLMKIKKSQETTASVSPDWWMSPYAVQRIQEYDELLRDANTRASHTEYVLEDEKRRRMLLEAKVQKLENNLREMNVPEVRDKPTACCFTTLLEASQRDPSVRNAAAYSKCGCCDQMYIVGYGSQRFVSQARVHHTTHECRHTHKKCAGCRRPVS